MSTKTLSFALATLNGSIDREASLKSASDTLDAHIAATETQDATIRDAVSAVFDQYKGANLTMPTIEGMTLRGLNAQPANYKVLGKQVLTYVRANSGKRETGAQFGIRKGVGGGVCRWADVPADAPQAGESDSSESDSDESTEA